MAAGGPNIPAANRQHHAWQEERACVWEKVNQGADSQSRRLRSKIQAIVTISSEVERSLIFAGAEPESLNNLIGTAINIRLLAERLTATNRFSV